MTRKSIRTLIIVMVLALIATAAIPALAAQAVASTFDLSNVNNGYVTVYFMGNSADTLRVGVESNGTEQYTTYKSGTRTNINLPAAGGQVTISLYKQVDGKSYQRMEQVSFTAKAIVAKSAVVTKSSSTKAPVVKEEPTVQVKATTVPTNSTINTATVETIVATNVETTAATTGTTHVTAVPGEYQQYLNSVKEISFSANDSVSRKAAELVAGKTSTQAKAMAIYSYISKNFSYDWDLYNKVVSGKVTKYTPNPNSILTSNKGICYDIASLYAAMCRSVGIPAKMVKGNCKVVGGYHAWNSVYDDATGNWVSLDITVNLGSNGSASWMTVGSGYSASSAV